MKLPILSAKKVIRILGKEGFMPIRQEGSHIFFRHVDGRTATVPIIPERIYRVACLEK